MMGKSKIHICSNSQESDSLSGPLWVENKGDGWYIYSPIGRGANPINYCPFCGQDLSKEMK